MVATNLNQTTVWRVAWLRVLFLIDFVGLFLVIWYAMQTLSVNRGDLLITLSASTSIIFWLTFRPKSIMPPLNSYQRAILCPLLASVTTLMILAAFREYYSGVYLAKLTILWSAWMFVARLILKALQPKPKVLLVGDSSFWPELIHSEKVKATKVNYVPSQTDNSAWAAIILDPMHSYSKEWLAWLAHADMASIPIISAPILLESLTGRIATDALEGRWAPSIFHGRAGYQWQKRGLDIIATVLALPILLPLGFLVAMAVYIDTGRPILFWQDRMGKDGKVFKMVKFRSMRTNAESQGAFFASRDDKRVTRLGAFLRKFRLDELPQFWNVLRGEMSIIGPRPEQVDFAIEFEHSIALYTLRHNVRPGITGWAQVMQGYAAGQDENTQKLRYDCYYIKYMSFWLDVTIVLKTIRTVLTGFGSR